MNAVERLWRALAARDWETARSELHPNATIEWPTRGERFDSCDAFIEVHRAIPGPWDLDVGRIITEGRDIASEVVVTTPDDTWYVASFFRLGDGRIQHATEYWVRREV